MDIPDVLYYSHAITDSKSVVELLRIIMLYKVP